MTSLSAVKTERIDVRTSRPVKQLLQEAARACHKNVSEFLLEAGINAADQTLANRCRFILDDALWQQFHEALDAPPKPLPRLEKMLTQPGLLD